MFDILSVKIAGADSKIEIYGKIPLYRVKLAIDTEYEIYKIALRLSMMDNFFNDFTIQVHNSWVCELCAEMRFFFANLAAEVTEFTLMLGMYPSAKLQHYALQWALKELEKPQ